MQQKQQNNNKTVLNKAHNWLTLTNWVEDYKTEFGNKFQISSI
jgi:hypothetical protein